MKQLQIIVFIIFSLNATAQKYIPKEIYNATWEYSNLKGKVKSIIIKNYTFIKTDSSKNIIKKYNTDTTIDGLFLTNIDTIYFNEKGLKTKTNSLSFYLKTINNENEVMSYDIENTPNIPKLKLTNFDTTQNGYGFAMHKQLFIYDSLDRLISVKNIGKNGENEHSVDFKYDKRSNLIHTKFWGLNYKPEDEYYNKYDKNDSLIEIEHYNNWANEFSVEKIKYGNKNFYETSLYLNDGRKYCVTSHEKLNDGTTILNEVHTSICNFKKQKHFYRKDKNNIILEQKFIDREGKLVLDSKSKNYKVDNKGRLIEQEVFNEMEKRAFISTYQYENDKMGNEISYYQKSTIFSYKKISTIEYYNQ